MNENDADVMVKKVFYVVFTGCILFIGGIYVFAFNA